MGNQISNNKIRQIVLLGLILILLYLIGLNLVDFLSAFLSAITLYVVFRNYYCRLTEIKNWKPWLAASYLMVISVLVVLVPLYYIMDILISKLSNSKIYVELLINYIETIHQYIEQKTGYDIIKSIDVKKLGEWATLYSSSLLSSTIDFITTVVMAYFVLYFMLVNTRKMEKAFEIMVPLKKSNISKIGDRFRKMIIANVVGIPVVAIGQGLVVFVGYLLFDVSSPFFLFVLTTIASVIPVVGGGLVYIPVGAMLLINNDMVGAIGVLSFGFLSAGVDNIMRFTFLKKIEDIHPLNSVFGIIVGLKLFGFIGLIFGPILISITLLLIKVYHDEFSDKENIIDEKNFSLYKENNTSE